MQAKRGRPRKPTTEDRSPVGKRRKGPQTTPTPLKILKGERSDRINRLEPKFEPITEPIKPPTDDAMGIGDFAEARIYGELVPLLQKHGLVTEGDRTAIEVMARTYQNWREAYYEVRRNGVLVTNARGDVKTNPAMAVMKACADTLIPLLREFGLTPSSRQRVIGNSPAETSDPLDDFTINTG